MLSSTLVLIKPDAVRRQLIAAILARLETKGLFIRGVKSFVFSDDLIAANYAHIAALPFFPELRDYLQSGMTIALWVSGAEAVPVVRRLVGVTNARDAAPGTIRGDFGVSTQRNLVHASDSDEAAAVELARFFPEGPTVGPDPAIVSVIYSATEA